MSAPSIFGELELLTEENRTANVRATSETLVLGLPHGKVEERVRAGDTAVLQVMYGISRVLACRLVNLSDKFVELESRSDPRRSRELREFRQKIFGDWST
jgi:CRP-like cAMP-binding protein